MSQQDQQDQRYQGWANYPTWAVNLWMANDEGLYREALDMAQMARDEAPQTSQVADRIWTVEQAERFSLADSFEAWIGEMAELDEASFRSDILGWALQQVDWHEIAASWLEDLS